MELRLIIERIPTIMDLAYYLIVGVLFALLYGEAAHARLPESALMTALAAFVGIFASLAIPPRIYKYSNQDHAAAVLTQLIKRAAVGSALGVATTVLAALIVGRITEPGFVGELYLFTLMSLFLFQGFGEVITPHVMYLQQTNQYNSNQLFAMLVAITLLLFILILYFLAFDLARPPDLHAYVRDLLAITIALVGYARATYLMAHH